MPLRSLRRRIRNRYGGHDWLEGALVVVGLVLLGLSGLSIGATAVIIAHFRDVESGFPAGPGVAQLAKGLGLILFPLLAVVTFLTARELLGPRLRGWIRRGPRRG
ncbi:MAG: hypothetical protein ACE14W_04020 [Candidatus Velamenicoccus archaeovorus]